MDQFKIKKEETFADRWDRTSELTSSKRKRKETRWKRRLDSIARLIENASTCAAIAVNDSSFLIATNKEFPRGKATEDKGYLLIHSVMEFFKKVASGQDTDDDFKKIFDEICDGAASGLEISSYKRTLFAKVEFYDKLRKAGKDEVQVAIAKRDLLSEMADMGEAERHYPKDEGAAFAVCLALFKDLEKVIKFIKINIKSDDPHIAAFLKAIRSYDESNIITKDRLIGKINEATDGHIHTHAEMKIIACLEEQLKSKEKYENYIGISKLCCMDCHAMIYAINKAVDYQNQIEIRGAHNARYPSEWTAPFNITGNPPKLSPAITGGRTRQSSVQDPFSLVIVTEYNRVYKEYPIPVAGLPQHHDDSQTSTDSGTDDRNGTDEFVATLQAKKEQLVNFTKSKIAKKISIEPKIFEAIDLLLKDIATCKQLQDWLKSWAEEDIIDYLKTVKEQHDVNLAQIIKEILSDEIFVGKLAASNFLKILQELEAAQGEQKAPAAPSFPEVFGQEKSPIPVAGIAPQAAAVEQHPPGLFGQTYRDVSKTGDALQGTGEMCIVGAFAASSTSQTTSVQTTVDTDEGKKRQAEKQSADPTETKRPKPGDSQK